MGLKEEFLKRYANLPLMTRKEIILVLDDEPLTWNSAYVEVYNNTPKGEKILKRLQGMKLL